MNKRGQEFPQSETIEYILLIALGIALALMLSNTLNTERYNSIRADDLSLALNSVFIPDGDISLTYNMGNEEREVIFEDNLFKTYINDGIREKKGYILVDRNYLWEARSGKVNSLEISKKGNRVEVA
ncbi:MAG: hypothetical protein CMH62_02235 [Nanoarchaeota archaeon]|nr:hypothetical protein [Nanoarchaeota archaeon]|tara:strand:- start:4025 stop:4405 length:381 start_codon:yes stop_codon:yes gene_type:complete